MAINSIGRTQADTAGFIPILWAQRALDVLRANIVLAKIVARDTDFEPGWKGKTLNVPFPGTFAAQKKTEGNPTTVSQASNPSSTGVTLSNHSYVDFLVEDFAQAQTNMDLMSRYMDPAAVALAEQLETDLMALVSSFTVDGGTPGTDLGAANLRTARKKLNDGKNPMTDRAVVMGTKDEIAILADSTLANYFAFAKEGAVAEGSIGRLYGNDLYVSQLTPLGAYLDVSGATAGNFTLTFGGQTTGNIAFNAGAATIQAALTALTSIGNGNISVTQAATGKFTLVFAGTLASNTASFSGTFGGLTGSGTIRDMTVNLALHKNAILLATRPLSEPPQDSGVKTASVVDPESGLSIRIQWQYDMSYRGVHCGLDLLYGFTKLRDVAGVRLLQ